MDVVLSEQAASKKRLPHGMWEVLEITSCCSICTEKHESRKQVTSLQEYITCANKHWQFGGSDELLLIISQVWPTVNHNLLLSVDFFSFITCRTASIWQRLFWSSTLFIQETGAHDYIKWCWQIFCCPFMFLLVQAVQLSCRFLLSLRSLCDDSGGVACPGQQ